MPELMREQYKISIIICTYNRAELLEGALHSLNAQSFPRSDFEVVVVDDGSTDNTEQVVRTLQDKLDCNLTFHKIAHAGRSAARNHGIGACRGEYVLFVDDDILAPPTLLQEHYDHHMQWKRSVIRGPIVNVTEYKVPENRETTWRDYSSAFFCTCNASVAREALIAVEGFDETFVEYGFEDNELGWRLREKGWVVRFNMKATIYHFKPILKKEQLVEMVQRAQELGRSAVAYHKKHPHWKVALATGLHPALTWWNRLQSNEWLHKYCLRQWNESAETMPAGKRAFLERRIFTYHYLRSLDAEKRRQRELT